MHTNTHVIHNPNLPNRPEVRHDPDAKSPLLTVQAVASELAVSKTTVYRLIERRELAVHRVGRGLRVSRTDLACFLAQRRATET